MTSLIGLDSKNRQLQPTSRVFRRFRRAGILLGGMVLSLALIAGVSAEMKPADISAIQKEIDAAGANWTAGESHITRMSADERRAMLGLLPEPAGTPDRGRRPAQSLAAPAYFSWGDHQGYNWITSVKNQGGCGSCWAFATTASFEARERIRINQPNLYIDLSEQVAVSCFKGDCDGANGTWIMQMIQSQGLPSETCFPYVSGSEYIPPCDDRCPTWYLENHYINTHGYWSSPSVAQMKAEIQANGPIQISIDIFEDFYSYAGGVYEHTTGAYDGGHLIIFYGWDDVLGCWLAKNSWGEWGEVGPNGQTGWFRIRMGTNEIDCEHSVYFLDPAPFDYLEIDYLNPSRNASAAAPEADVLIQFDTEIDMASFTTSTVFASGSLSGIHPGVAGWDFQTGSLAFRPDDDFLPGELVTVTMTPDLVTTSGQYLTTGYNYQFTAAVGTGIGGFAEAVDYSTSAGPLGMCTGDLNGDGFADLVSANTAGRDITVILANGDGTFGAPAAYAAGLGARSVTVADLDRDGHLDIIVANQQVHYLSTFMNLGDGTFGTAGFVATVSNPRSVVAGDFNSDGYADLAVLSQSPEAVRFHFNDGAGNFYHLSQRSVSGTAYSLKVADVDNDGDLDLAYPAYSVDELIVLLNDGPGTFDSELHLDAGDGPRGTAFADFNGDGLCDPIVANFSSKDITVLTNDGTGAFTSQLIDTDPLKPETVVVGDFNADGFMDIAAYGSGGIAVVLGDGAGGFGASAVQCSGNFAEGVTADFDGDGDLDLAGVSYSGSEMTVLLKDGCCQGRVGDANGVGGDEPTIGDVSVLIDAKFITGICDGIMECLAEADINQSGGSEPICDDVSIGDISILIDYLFISGSEAVTLSDCL